MKKTFVVLMASGLVVVSATLAMAQPECSKAKPGQACAIVIDRRAPVSGVSVKVENRTPVTVVLLHKSPFESCKNEVKREELPDVSAIPTLLGLIKDAAGTLVFPAAAPAERNDEAQQIIAALDRTRAEAETQVAAGAAVKDAYEAANRKVKDFYKTDYYQSNGVADETLFKTKREAAVKAVDGALQQALPNTTGGEAAYKAVLAHFSAYVRSGSANPNLIPLFEDQINRARTALDALSKLVSELQSARAKFESTKDYLKDLENPDWYATAAITPDINAKLTGSFSCTSDISGKPTLDPPVVYTIIFQNTPRLSLTAGVLMSSLPRNSIGLEDVLDKRENDVVTSHKELREHPSTPQAIPFSFLNVRIGSPWRWGDRLMTFNVTPGIGLNPNNGDTHAEFFLGAALGFGNFFVTGGVHAGHKLRAANGFQPGDRPAGDLTLPVETPWAPGGAVAVSYRIPLK